jgi:hypothetical protein
MSAYVRDAAAPLDADSGTVAPEPVGISFQPIATLTEGPDAQTVAHMALTGLLFLPGGRGVLVWEKSGRITHYALHVDSLIWRGEFWVNKIETINDCGLISLALDPDWEDNGFIFAGACISTTHSVVRRLTFHGDDYESVLSSIVDVIQFGDSAAPTPWHNVGSIGFFPDAERSLWILVGDKNVSSNAQDVSRNLGGALRIIPSRAAVGGYLPHPDNPFGGAGSSAANQSSPDLYAWGMRSPWQGAIDDQGRIWVGDVGDKVEEINLLSKPGQNFGWNIVQGECGDDAMCEHMTDPIVYWDRGADHAFRVEDALASPSTKRVAWVGTPHVQSALNPYRGFLNGTTLISDMCVGFVRAVAVDAAGKVTRNDFVGHLNGLSGSAQGPDGYMYVTSFGGCTNATFGLGGGIYRVVLRSEELAPVKRPALSDKPLVEDPLGPMPYKLSQTGIFKSLRKLEPIERAIRYEPEWPLWTNGSAKYRWLLLPDGKKIDNSERASWVFPEGTLFWKTFGYPDGGFPARVETRILRKARAGWEYHVYQWWDGDADLLPLERRVRVQAATGDGNKLAHEIPSRFDCRTCHESNLTPVIGFDELRLNTSDAGGSQLAQLEAAGLFAHPLPAQPESVAHSDELTRQVLGYLHGNCAHCHNQGASSMSTLDLSHKHALANIAGVATEATGQAAGIRVQPGAPEQSILYLAFSAAQGVADLEPMPPIGVQLRDEQTIELLRDWIVALRP